MTIRQVVVLVLVQTMVININRWNSILRKNCSLTHARLEEVTLMSDFNFDQNLLELARTWNCMCCNVATWWRMVWPATMGVGRPRVKMWMARRGGKTMSELPGSVTHSTMDAS